LEGDADTNFIHYAIQKHHWSPSQVNEFLNADDSMKALFFASTKIRIDDDKKQLKELEKKKR
jgi:hypothetical protein